MKYRTAKAKTWEEKCRKGGINSGKARRAKMLDQPEALRPRDKGVFLGVLEWRANDEQVRRWTIRQGPRRNNVSVARSGKTVICGWDHLLSKLRGHLSPITRQAI